jgi:hypothetical protein
VTAESLDGESCIGACDQDELPNELCDGLDAHESCDDGDSYKSVNSELCDGLWDIFGGEPCDGLCNPCDNELSDGFKLCVV